jgi:hypothetical protein
LNNWKVQLEIRNMILQALIKRKDWSILEKYDKLLKPKWTDYCLFFDWDIESTKDDFLKK